MADNPHVDPVHDRTSILPRDMPPGRDNAFPQGDALRQDLDALARAIRLNTVRIKRIHNGGGANPLTVRDGTTEVDNVEVVTFVGDAVVSAGGAHEAVVTVTPSSAGGSSFYSTLSLAMVANDWAGDDTLHVTSLSKVIVDLSGYEEFYLSISSEKVSGTLDIEYYVQYYNGSAWVDAMPSAHLSLQSSRSFPTRTGWLSIPTAMKADNMMVRVGFTRSTLLADGEILNATIFFRKEISLFGGVGTAVIWQPGIYFQEEPGFDRFPMERFKLYKQSVGGDELYVMSWYKKEITVS